MLTFDALIDIFTPKGACRHHVAALGTLFIHGFELGDEGAFGIVGAAIKFAAAAVALHYLAATLGACYIELFSLFLA